MAAFVSDDSFVLLRARYLSACSSAAFLFRNGTSPLNSSAEAYSYDDVPLRRHDWSLPAWRSDFAVQPDGKWRVYAVPILPYRNLLPSAGEIVAQLRFLPCTDRDGAVPQHASLEVDWIRLARAPTVTSVTGCGRTVGVDSTAQHRPPYRPIVRSMLTLDQSFAYPEAAMVDMARINATDDARLPYAASYSCALAGGDVITVAGLNLGGADSTPQVFVDGRACTNVSWVVPESSLTCITPPGPVAPELGGAGSGKGAPVVVSVLNGAMPLLRDDKPLLTYAATPAAPAQAPVVSNVNARAFDVSWRPVPDTWQAMATTGYLVQWRGTLFDACPRDAQCQLVPGAGPASGGADVGFQVAADGSWISPAPIVQWAQWPVASAVELSRGRRDGPLVALRAGRTGEAKILPSLDSGWVVTGNITTTTLWGLRPDSRYQVRVAALVEDTLAFGHWHTTLDMYGQRPAVPGAVVGTFSAASEDIVTLPADVLFTRFDVNATVDYGPAHAASTVNSLHWAGGEGSYGLVLVGDASAGNCNGTHACCDGFGGRGFSDRIAALERGSRESSPLLGRYVQLFDSCGEASNATATVGADGYGWVDVGAYPTEIPTVWGSAALGLLRSRIAQLGSWRSHHKKEYPWFGYDDASDLAIVPDSFVADLRSSWQRDQDAAANATILRSFVHNGTGYTDVTGLAPAAAAALLNASASSSSSASAAGRQLFVELVSRETPAGTNYSFWRHWDAPSMPDAFYDGHGRRYAGVPQDPQSTCGLSCAAVQPVAPAALSSPPWRGPDSVGAPESLDSAYNAPSSSANGTIIYLNAPVTGRRALQLANAQRYSGWSANRNATAPCGPALRLTGSHPGQAGAAWYARPQQVREGFETVFVLRMANPSRHCRTMDGASAHCRSRGGGGMAFVLQNWHPHALGHSGGDGLGYGGLPLSLVVEFDTGADGQWKHDPHENHVSVHVARPACGDGGGWGRDASEPGLRDGGHGRNDAHHSLSLGHARFRGVPDLSDGIHAVRVVYDRSLDPALVSHPSFVAENPHAATFFSGGQQRQCAEAADADSGSGSAGPLPTPAWTPGAGGPATAGAGSLFVYIDDLSEPVLIVPVNLDAVLGLGDTQGRAWAGFTAATGEDAWQTHDVLSWELTQDRGGDASRLPL